MRRTERASFRELCLTPASIAFCISSILVERSSAASDVACGTIRRELTNGLAVRARAFMEASHEARTRLVVIIPVLDIYLKVRVVQTSSDYFRVRRDSGRMNSRPFLDVFASQPGPLPLAK